MAFNLIPYTNFHDLNLDWILDRVKEMIAAKDEVVANMEAAATNARNSADTAENIVDTALGTIGDATSGAVADWLEENVTPSTSVVLDKSLSIKGAAADAKAAGVAVSGLRNFWKENFNDLTWSQSSIDASGNVTSSPTAILTGLIPTHGGIAVTVPDFNEDVPGFNPYYLYVAVYSDENTFVSLSAAQSNGFAILVDEGYYFRLMAKYQDNSAIAPANAPFSQIVTLSPTDTDIRAVPYAGEEGKAADARATSQAILELYTDKANVNALNDLKSAVKESPNYNLRIGMNANSSNLNGIQYAWNDNVCSITGTATAVSFNNLFMSQNSLPAGIHAGDVLRTEYASENVWLIFYDYSGDVLTNISESKQSTIIKIPDTCTGLIIRLWVGNGTTVNESVCPKIFINDNCVIKAVDVATLDETGKTNMRPYIQKMLDTYGYCKLDAGVFYVDSAIILKEGDVLEGCGEATEIRLMSGNAKVAIKVRKYSTVKNLSIIGAYTDLTESDFSSTSGTRYGIHYYKGSSDTYDTGYCSITNVHIRNFTGSGIYQYGTGGNVEQGLFVSNVHIKNCWCGIYIYSNSEFCRYVNVQITYCYIACINGGGNNAFDNCVIHAYTIGMKIDGTQNNTAHGMCSNTSFCHTGNNVGSAITIGDVAHGFVFSACNIWYNSVDITNSSGIVFTGCEFGRGTTGAGATINIDGGNTVMFGNCVFMNDVTYPPNITITNNSKVKFNACYGSVSGDAITA